MHLNLNFVYLQNIILYEYVPALLEEEIEPYLGKNLHKKILFFIDLKFQETLSDNL